MVFTYFFIALDSMTHYQHNINTNLESEVSNLLNDKISLINIIINQQSYILVVKNLKNVQL